MAGRGVAAAVLLLAGCPDLGDPPAADAGPEAGAPDAAPTDAAPADAAPERDGQVGTDASTDGGAPDAMPDAPPACPEDPVGVEMSYMRFVPRDVTVQVGCPVVWTNNDGTNLHIVTSGTPELPAADFMSPELRNGDTFSFTFEASGVFVYFCSTHPDVMRDATVTVE